MAILHRNLVSASANDDSSLYTCSLIDNCVDPDIYTCLRCVYISPPPPPPVRHKSPDTPFLPYLISAICALGVAFLILTTCTILLRRRRNSRSTRSLEQDTVFVDGPTIIDHPIWHIVTVGLPQSVIDSITTFHYKRTDELIEATDCSVCLTEFEEDDHLRLLPKCSHAFHLPCIDTWLTSHKNCPLCRAPVSVPLPVPVVTSSADETSEVDNLGIEGVRIAQILKRNRDNRVLSDLGDNSRIINQQPVRRSVSLDASVSVLDASVLGGQGSSSKLETTMVVVVDKGTKTDSSMPTLIKSSRLIKSSSIGFSLHKAPVSMKRSLSTSAKILSSFRGSKSQSSTSLLPL